MLSSVLIAKSPALDRGPKRIMGLLRLLKCSAAEIFSVLPRAQWCCAELKQLFVISDAESMKYTGNKLVTFLCGPVLVLKILSMHCRDNVIGMHH
jgi:hypothetical protein